ncbi:hypothetical protein PHYSODRAFT_354433 [Phytophthora sojae]|uniref:MYND-type domain-containing protein n=1 Tax=Phytophthora sojae (strain P6497) TaxID=1094619 RepID=G4ZB73_PHYSP|nr:hypothetical protein PHYSODRAFT_354433 [Phytophthora sojae]EGZ22039.1 hypothetical protein PHYSODRAFT_354433 [Phytophthora sojae]|eukprot:XP_009524756.1 hypothetical protein PHYSODRAFT_354433 [Phytophthora sojae]
MRLLEHFKQHGGEVWSIGAGCQSCRQKLQDVSGLKRCANCDAALFCGRVCQLKAWPAHKAECGVIATFQRLHKASASSDSRLATLLEKLSWSLIPKKADDSKTAGVASSIGLNGPELPGWFFTVDFESASKEQQKALHQTALELYGLLKDEECWTRDKESFPRSSYTLVEVSEL